MRHAALALLLVAVAIAAPVAASPQPTPVCGYCGGSFERAAEDAGVNATVAESTATVQVHANGSATWTVRNRLSNGSAAFREHPNRLDVAARQLATESYGLPESARLLSVRLEGDTVVIVTRDRTAARRHAGLLVVDYLHEKGGEPWYQVNADRFTIRGPPGTVVTNTPESGRVEGRTATWHGSATGRFYEAPDLEGSPYVVFGPDRSAVTQARTTAALASATLPIVAEAVSDFLLPQTVVFGLVLGVVVAALRRWEATASRRSLAAVFGVLGVVGTVGFPVVHGPRGLTAPPLLALGYAVLAGTDAGDRLHTTRRQAGGAAGLLAASFVLVFALHAATGSDHPLRAAWRATAVGFPFAALLPLGGVVDAPPGRVARWWGVAVLSFAAAIAAVVNLVSPPVGLGAGLFGLFFAVAAIFVPLVGVPILLLGRAWRSEALN